MTTKCDEEFIPPRIFLLLDNPSKHNNLGPILRCAAAFAVTQVVAVGFEKCSIEGSHGASKHVPMIAFPTVEQAAAYLRSPTLDGGCGCCRLVGLLSGAAGAFSSVGYNVKVVEGLAHVNLDNKEGEILLPSAKSFPVNSKPFLIGGNTCFVLSKLSKGLPLSLANVCDDFVHVPHATVVCKSVDSEETSAAILLDIQSCLSIALSYFAAWAKYDQRMVEGYKFEVGKVDKGRVLDSIKASQATERKHAKIAQEKAADEAIGSDCLANAFATNVSEGQEDY